jgi:hypothetical protein
MVFAPEKVNKPTNYLKEIDRSQKIEWTCLEAFSMNLRRRYRYLAQKNICLC